MLRLKPFVAGLLTASIGFTSLASADNNDTDVLLQHGQDLGLKCTAPARQSTLSDNPSLEGGALERQCLATLTRLYLINQAPVLVPNNQQLIGYYNEHKQEYAQPKLYTFEQHYFTALPNPAATLERLNDGFTVSSELFAPGNHFHSVSAAAIQRTFGNDFAKAVTGTAPQGWFGPLQSRSGQHLVRIISVEESRIPTWQSQRSSLTSRWQRLQQEKWLNQKIFELRQQQLAPQRP